MQSDTYRNVLCYNNALDTFTSITLSTTTTTTMSRTIQTYTRTHIDTVDASAVLAFSLLLSVQYAVCCAYINAITPFVCCWRDEEKFSLDFTQTFETKFRYSFFSFVRSVLRSLVDRVKCLLRFSIHISSAFAFDNNLTQCRRNFDFCILFILCAQFCICNKQINLNKQMFDNL